MDVIIVAGMAKDQGKQYSVYRKYQLGRLWSNLKAVVAS
jgi:hypothetical protein